MVANPAAVVGFLVGLVVEGHRIHQQGFLTFADLDLGIVCDQGRVRLPALEPRDLLVREFGHRRLVVLRYHGPA